MQESGVKLENVPNKESDCVRNIEDEMLGVEVVAEVKNGDNEVEQEKISCKNKS